MNFFYEAVDENGQSVVGKIDAQDATTARNALQQQGYRATSLAPNIGPNSVNPTQTDMTLAMTPPYASGVATAVQSPSAQIQRTTLPTTTPTRTGGIILAGEAAKMAAKQPCLKVPPGVADGRSKLGGVSNKDMAMFFQQFASLIRSGFTLFSALENLAPRTPNVNLARTAREMSEAARKGERVTDVMANYPRIYPEHIVATLRAGELGGFLEISLAEIALTYEQNIALYRGTWIPKFMAGQAIFMIPFVLPLFTSRFFSAFFSGGASIGAWLVNYLSQVVLYALLTGLICMGAIWGSRRLQLPEYRRWLDHWALKIPPFGDLQRQASLAAFVRMLRRLYQAGVGPIHAWEGAMNVSGNSIIRERLTASFGLMQQGASLADAFQATHLFNGNIEQLIVTGQHSGELPEMLDQAAEFYQNQIEESSKKAKFAMLRMGVLAGLVFGGFVVCWMAYSFYGGMFKFLEDFAGPE